MNIQRVSKYKKAYLVNVRMVNFCQKADLFIAIKLKFSTKTHMYGKMYKFM
jgi:hypothetical protein